MKTRIIKTKFWSDSITQSLSPLSKLLFIYLLTCPYVSLTCYFEISDGQIKLDTGLSDKELMRAKEELSKKKRVYFCNGWVFIPNLDKHNPYWKSPKTEKAYKDELKNIPKEILDCFNNKIDSSIDSTIHSSMDSTPKTKNINNKTEIINNNTSIQTEDKISIYKDDYHKNINYLTSEELLKKDYLDQKFSHLNVSFTEVKRKAQELYDYCQAKGRKYKDYRAFLRNALVKDYGYKFRQ